MGSAQSSSTPETNAVRVATEKGEYAGGDTVIGAIYLNVVTPFHSSGVALRVKGTERVSWFEERVQRIGIGKSQRKVRNRLRVSRKNEILKVEHIVHTFDNDQVPVGQYTFPFSFVLPTDLPSSFSDAISLKDAEASRVFKVKGVVYAGVDFKYQLKYTQLLTVNESYHQDVFSQSQHESRELKSCCCFSSGYIFFQFRLDKNCYIPGETAKIICEVKNDSSVRLPRMELVIIREFALRGSGSTLRHNVQLESVRCSGFEAHSDATGQNARMIPFLIPENSMGQGDAPSSESFLIRNRFFVEIRIAIQYGNDVQILLPLALAHKPLREWNPLLNDRPQRWSPTSFDSVPVPLPMALALAHISFRETPSQESNKRAIRKLTNLETPLMQTSSQEEFNK
eukprot:c11988_g1_i1.p1 GENE.c11988_g1_i1~~c11988_g1_i1.p1  ORF type:complete len:406 (+),score=88.38 c11988_g1_i1:28-1218(+)